MLLLLLFLAYLLLLGDLLLLLLRDTRNSNCLQAISSSRCCEKIVPGQRRSCRFVTMIAVPFHGSWREHKQFLGRWLFSVKGQHARHVLMPNPDFIANHPHTHDLAGDLKKLVQLLLRNIYQWLPSEHINAKYAAHQMECCRQKHCA